MSVQPRISSKGIVVGSKPRDPKLPAIIPTQNGTIKLQPLTNTTESPTKSGDTNTDRVKSPEASDWNTSVAVPLRKSVQQSKIEAEEIAKTKKLTLQKAEALVQSREEKKKLREEQELKSPKTPTGPKKPVSATRIKIYEHSGKWEFSRIEQTEAWSCCLNTKKDSQGCSFTYHDPMKIDYDAI